MAVTLRRGTAEDAADCGRIMYEAFTEIAERHSFPSDFPEPEVGIGLATRLLGHPGFYAVVAERDGRVIGSNFLDERSTVAGLGPITVAPDAQDSGAGRRLMEDALERADTEGFPGVRLLQAAYHNRTLALYAKLGFDARELCCTLQGPAISATIGGCGVRPAADSDVEGCDRLCVRVHGHTRTGELVDAIHQGSALVVERDGRITGYSTGVAYFSHSVGEGNEDVEALIGASPEYGGPGFILPARNSGLLRWCLGKGLRIVHTLTLMTRGLYNEPQGAYLPSILM